MRATIVNPEENPRKRKKKSATRRRARRNPASSSAASNPRRRHSYRRARRNPSGSGGKSTVAQTAMGLGAAALGGAAVVAASYGIDKIAMSRTAQHLAAVGAGFALTAVGVFVSKPMAHGAMGATVCDASYRARAWYAARQAATASAKPASTTGTKPAAQQLTQGTREAGGSGMGGVVEQIRRRA